MAKTLFRHGGKGLAGLAAVLAGLAFAPGAQAYIYWTDAAGNTVGRANLDGGGVKQNWITGANAPTGVAVDGRYVYWGNSGANTVGRADIDGTAVNQQLVTGAATPGGVAVDAGHLYWVNQVSGYLGRADLDGTDADQQFISPTAAVVGVAVDRNHVYWTNTTGFAIGRADLDGTDMNQDFVQTPGQYPVGVAVDGGHVYWTARAGSPRTVGRANLDGTNANPTFITAATNPIAVAVDGRYVYWANETAGSIGRANLDGTAANPTFVTGVGRPQGLAVDGLGPGGSSTPPGGPAAPTPRAGDDSVAPRLWDLRLARGRFSTARGTRVRYRLSEHGVVGFRVEAVVRGRRTRYRPLRGSFSRAAVEGLNSFTFRGRLRGRPLRPGGYRLVASATDPAGNRSALARVRFRVL